MSSFDEAKTFDLSDGWADIGGAGLVPPHRCNGGRDALAVGWRLEAPDTPNNGYCLLVDLTVGVSDLEELF